MNHYDPDKHIYTINTRPVPSITQALFEAGIVDTKHYDKEGRERGSFIHMALDYLDRKDLDHSSVPEEWQGYIYGYQEFKACTGFEPDIKGSKSHCFIRYIYTQEHLIGGAG